MSRENPNYPFAVGDSLDILGVVTAEETECPGIQYLSAGQDNIREYYAVLEGSVPRMAADFGMRLPSQPDIRLYPLYSDNGGWKIIEYEIQKYRVQNHLALPVSLMEKALEGMEAAPAYFGMFPVPASTPWGHTIRHRDIGNGVCWIETDQFCQVVSICRTMCDDLSETALELASTGQEKAGVPDTWGFLFFTKEDSCLPLFELLPLHPEWLGAIDCQALQNAVVQYHPTYTVAYNFREQLGLNSVSGQLLREFAGESLQNLRLHMLSYTPDAGTEFFTFLQ